MISIEVDMGQLDRDIKKAAKGIGETGKNAVARWGVSTARELAKQTQPHGIGGTKKQMMNSIEAGMRSVLVPVDAKTFKRRGAMEGVGSPDAINKWVDENRRGNSKGHAKLESGGRKAICRKSDFTKALSIRRRRGGIAKGGWVGAGQAIAKRQRGANRIKIGKNYLSWTQKHTQAGTAKRTGSLFRPTADIINKARHTRSQYVINKGEMRRAVMWGGRNTLKWYKRTARAMLKKV